jgi:hypothetical protein
MGTTLQTVGKWRQRYLDAGVDGLLDEPRPGTPPKLDDEQVKRVLTRTLESQPEAATHWSTHDMAAKCGLSQSSISRRGGHHFCPVLSDALADRTEERHTERSIPEGRSRRQSRQVGRPSAMTQRSIW